MYCINISYFCYMNKTINSKITYCKKQDIYSALHKYPHKLLATRIQIDLNVVFTI